MSRRTGADMDAEILLRVANRDDITAGMRAFFLRDALYWCVNTFEHRDLEVITTASQTSGTDVITPAASDVLYVEMLKCDTDKRVVVPGQKDLVEDVDKPSGNVTKFYHWGSLLYSDRKPTEDKSYSVWYIQKPAEITTNGNSPLDEMFDVVLVMKAAEIGLTTVRDFKEAAVLESLINNHIAEYRLPRRMQRYNRTGAGIQMRFK